MSIIQGNAKQGSTRGFYNFPIEQSLRFNDDDSAYLSWTPASAGNRKTWTWSGWVKRGNLLTSRMPFFGAGTSTPFLYMEFVAVGSGGATGNELRISQFNGSSDDFNVTTDALYRDPSAWYHIVFAVDTTQATASDRVKIYVNGSQITVFHTNTYPSLNFDTEVNTAEPHNLGTATGIANYFDGYMAEVNFIDGTALDADSFGELKNGVWIPKDPSGLTYGTNGFRLSFADDAEVEAFNTVLANGNNGTQSITGVGFSPDLVWCKARNQALDHSLYDTVRGATKALATNLTSAEATYTNAITSFDSDGFTTGDKSLTNNGGATLAYWCWKAGDSNVSNTVGSIPSTVRANTTYGFSIVSYTGDGSSSADVGHSLGAVPKFIIHKRLDSIASWQIFHSDLTANHTLSFDTGAEADSTSGNSGGLSTSPSSSTFGFVSGLTSVNNVNANGASYICYCWSEKSGYSKFGSYTGNGSATGPSVTDLGFKPAWIMIKAISSGTTERWCIHDNTRTVANGNSNVLFADDSLVENTSLTYDIDFLDNGFQVKTSHESHNQDTKEYIYAAFADTREAAFWLDQSGNDNDWQPVNLDHNDTVADSPTDNFATWNPLASTGSGVTGYGWSMSDGNLVFTPTNASGYNNVTTSTMAMTSGKYYLEFKPLGTPTSGWPAVGLCYTDSISEITRTSNFQSSNDVSILIFTSGNLQPFGSTSASAYGNAISSGDVLMLAVDCDNGKVWWGENGTWFNSGNPTTGTNAGDTFTAGTSVSILMTGYNGAGGVEINAGQQPFKYDPPA